LGEIVVILVLLGLVLARVYRLIAWSVRRGICTRERLHTQAESDL
jgi:hypothetical protein